MIFVGVFIAVALIGTVNSQTFSMGNCNTNIETVQNFDQTKFLGKWYVIKRSFNIPEDQTKCNRYDAKSSTNHVYDVVNSFASNDVKDGNGVALQNIYYSLDADDLDSGKLKFNPGFILDEQPLWILAVEYHSHLVVYSCVDAYQGKLEYAWILSRTPNPENVTILKTDTILSDRNINLKLIDTKQNC